MKRILLFFSFLFVFISCQQKYYTLFVNADEAHEELSFAHFIYADTDEEALTKAVDYMNEYFRLNEIQYLESAITYSITDKQGNPIDVSPAKELDIVPKQKEYARQAAERAEVLKVEEKKAFAGAEFGMSVKDVSKIPSFKSYLKYDNQIDGVRKQIGTSSYNVYLLFGDNDALYCVLFYSSGYRADSYDSLLKKDFINLKDIFISSYGNPSRDYGFPSYLNTEKGKISWACEWIIGNKGVKMGIEETDNYRYRVYACIENKLLANEYRQRQNEKVQAERKEAIEEAASLF